MPKPKDLSRMGVSKKGHEHFKEENTVVNNGVFQ